MIPMRYKNLCVVLFTDMFCSCPQKANELFGDIINQLSDIINYAFNKPTENVNYNPIENSLGRL